MAEDPPPPPGRAHGQDPEQPPPPRTEPGSYEPPPAPMPAAPYPPPTKPAASPPPQPQPHAAPPPPPPAGWVPPPPAEKRSNRKLWITVLSVLGVIVLGIGACTVWFVGAVKAPVDESNRFLAEIDAGDYSAAAARTDPACNAGMSAADLEGLFQGADITYDLTSSSVTNNSATVSGSFSASNLSFRSIELSLRKDSVWRVCGFTVN